MRQHIITSPNRALYMYIFYSMFRIKTTHNNQLPQKGIYLFHYDNGKYYNIWCSHITGSFFEDATRFMHNVVTVTTTLHCPVS